MNYESRQLFGTSHRESRLRLWELAISGGRRLSRRPGSGNGKWEIGNGKFEMRSWKWEMGNVRS